MSSTELCVVVLLAWTSAFTAAQTSCKGRCGVEYYRGYECQCDYGCLSYGECCGDFESQCTTANSCKGRCGELFRRGRRCSCDMNCNDYKQCCPDFDSHCAEEATTEGVNGAASAIATVNNDPCPNVNDNKPKEPTLDEPTDYSTFSEDNNADDHLIPQDDLSDDTNGQVSPNDVLEDPEATPIPDSTSSYEPTTIEPTDTTSTEPTQDPETLELTTATVPSQTDNAPTQADDSSTTVHPTIEEAPTESTDLDDQVSPKNDTEPTQADDSPTTVHPTTAEASTGTTVPPGASEFTTSPDPEANPPQPTTEADISGQTTTTSEAQTEASPTAYTPKLETETQPEDNISPDEQTSGATVAQTNEPGATTEPIGATSDCLVDSAPTQGSLTSTVPDVVTEVMTSSTLDATPVPTTVNPVQTTSKPGQDDSLIDAEIITTKEPSIDVSPTVSPNLVELDAAMTTPNIPTSTHTEVQTQNNHNTDNVTPAIATTVEPLNVTPEPTKPTEIETTAKPEEKPDTSKPLVDTTAVAKPTVTKPSVTKPSVDKPSKPVTKPLDRVPNLTIDNPRDYQADDSNDTNLCSGRPVSAVTTLGNGTTVVFRGHYFWFLDALRQPGPARGITQVWGVPSPIDTAFTRCNCQGKTYIFKGSKYWRFENDALDDHYPKIIQTGFDGLKGHITAALSVPQYRQRREAVYFFKRGGSVQKYSYQFGTSPTCNRKPPPPPRPQYTIYTSRVRTVRQAVSGLGQTISIRTSWRGFPSTITAAVSIPNNREADGYKYHVFSRSKSYSVRMDGARPALSPPKPSAPPQSDNVINCPKKV